MTISLDALSVGESGTVVKVGNGESIKRRLMDLGIACGSKIECISRSPLGDPTAYYIKGTVIAIRNDDSRFIEVV